MTSKRGAIEDTKKAINIARRGPEKEVLKLGSFLDFLYWRGEGVRGDFGGPLRGGGGNPPATPGLRHPHHF